MFSTNRTLALAIVSVLLAAAPVLTAADRATLNIGGVDYTLGGYHGDLNAGDDVILTFAADLRVTAVLLTPEREPAGETFLVGSHVHSETLSAPTNGRLRISIDGSFAETLVEIEADLIASLPNDQWSIDVTGWTLERSVLTIEQPAGVVVSFGEFDRVRQR